MLKTDCIRQFLQKNTHPELSELYTSDMEVQVNVAQDEGDVIDGTYGNGKTWRGFTDGMTTWKSFRIPWNAWSEPAYEDSSIRFDFDKHVEGIGMSGWNWRDCSSTWVAFDFDAIIGHSDKHGNKVSHAELQNIRKAAQDIPWTTIRHSTSGNGLHIYVFLPHIPTRTHTEHAALARSVLQQMSALSGYAFHDRVDICGGIMWAWHRKMRGQGLKLLKAGTVYQDVPSNWREHVDVITTKTTKIAPGFSPSSLDDEVKRFNKIAVQRNFVSLDTGHVALLKYLSENHLFHWWDSDRHMLVTHTHNLVAAHVELNMRGQFLTTSPGHDLHTQNCFLFPINRGAWIVRRYGRGTSEHKLWKSDGAGFTFCALNRDLDFETASHAAGGIEDASGAFTFDTYESAQQAAQYLEVDVPDSPKLRGRETTLKKHKDGSRVVIEVARSQADASGDFADWVRKGAKWQRVVYANLRSKQELDTSEDPDTVRHLVNGDSDAGWAIQVGDSWNIEPLTHVKAALQASGMTQRDATMLTGSAILRPWRLVVIPFAEEYPGDRTWNRQAPQLTCAPDYDFDGKFPHWRSILKHVGSSLDEHVKEHLWCRSNRIHTGEDYLFAWVASMFQRPFTPLPYLFICSEAQNTGKSIFHEALSTLMTSEGYAFAKNALKSEADFNGELDGCVLCVVEELSLTQKSTAYGKIKDWVTSPMIAIHKKRETPYMRPNTLHFVHTANEHSACPAFPGDTRIVVLTVESAPKTIIPKEELMAILKKEAPAFLGAVMQYELPNTNDRLGIPVVSTPAKMRVIEATASELQLFIQHKCHYAPGEYITLSEFFERFQAWLDPTLRTSWGKHRVSKEMPNRFPKGRFDGANWVWGNITFDPALVDTNAAPLVRCGNTEMLRRNQ